MRSDLDWYTVWHRQNFVVLFQYRNDKILCHVIRHFYLLVQANSQSILTRIQSDCTCMCFALTNRRKCQWFSTDTLTHIDCGAHFICITKSSVAVHSYLSIKGYNGIMTMDLNFQSNAANMFFKYNKLFDRLKCIFVFLLSLFFFGISNFLFNFFSLCQWSFLTILPNSRSTCQFSRVKILFQP